MRNGATDNLPTLTPGRRTALEYVAGGEVTSSDSGLMHCYPAGGRAPQQKTLTWLLDQGLIIISDVAARFHGRKVVTTNRGDAVLAVPAAAPKFTAPQLRALTLVNRNAIVYSRGLARYRGDWTVTRGVAIPASSSFDTLRQVGLIEIQHQYDEHGETPVRPTDKGRAVLAEKGTHHA